MNIGFLKVVTEAQGITKPYIHFIASYMFRY